jgi:hypothetical protein
MGDPVSLTFLEKKAIDLIGVCGRAALPIDQREFQPDKLRTDRTHRFCVTGAGG